MSSKFHRVITISISLKFDKCNNNNLSENQSNPNFTILVLFTFGKKAYYPNLLLQWKAPIVLNIITIKKVPFQVLSTALTHTLSLGVYVRQKDVLGQ